MIDQGAIIIMSKHYRELDQTKEVIRYIKKFKKLMKIKISEEMQEELIRLEEREKEIKIHIEKCLKSLRV